MESRLPGKTGLKLMNAGPFSARRLANAPLPVWLKEPENVKAAPRAAAAHCAKQGVDVAKLAPRFSLAHPDITTTIAGSANPANIRQWAKWPAERLDQELFAEVQQVFQPVKNLGHVEGLGEQLIHGRNERTRNRHESAPTRKTAAIPFC